MNFDATHLYVGGTDAALPTNVDNNAYVIFVSGGTAAGADNFWYVNSLPNGLDRLHNVGFSPAVNVAILVGDIYGDGTQTNFGLYHAEGPDFGQGVFATPLGTEAEPGGEIPMGVEYENQEGSSALLEMLKRAEEAGRGE